jgi:predicted outer membrane repeat protein
MGRRVIGRTSFTRGLIVESLEPRRLFSSIYVDANAIGPKFDGTSWSSPFRDLQQALAMAKAGDNVLVAGGVYTPSITGDRTASFRLKSGVKIWGGYAGARKSNPNRRDTGLWVSVLSGELGVKQSPWDNTLHIVTAAKTDRSAGLDGFTIRDGYSDDSIGDGAGLYLKSGATVSNCIIEDNEAKGRGGGMFNADTSSLYVQNCTFVRNKSMSGGGLAIAFVGPSSVPHPGPMIVNCMFSSNSAYAYGGAIYSLSYGPTVFGCTFVANSAGTGGGGFANVGSSPVLGYSTFTKNRSNAGGAIYDNLAATTVSNCIIWDNAVPDWGQDPQIHGAISVDHSDVQGGAAGVANIDSDPLFVRVPAYGKIGYWLQADDDFGDLRLQPQSPCIDAGNSNTSLADPLDLAGKPRVYDIQGMGQNPDMGAFEYQPNVLAARPATPDGLDFSGGGYMHRVVLSWNDVDGEAGYDIYRGASAGGWNDVGTPATRIASTSANVTVFEDNNVMLGWDYSYWVQARSQGGGPQFYSGLGGDLGVSHKHLKDGVLIVEGSAADDKVKIDFYNHYVSVFDGRSDPYSPFEPVKSIQVFLGDGNDSLAANPKMRVLFVDAGTGNDTILAGVGNDTILGGSGNDLVKGGDGNDCILGGNGNDTLYGDAGNDTIDGGNHRDRIYGGDRSDVLLGGKGNDVLVGNDSFRDTINGGDGFDRALKSISDVLLLVEEIV